VLYGSGANLRSALRHQVSDRIRRICESMGVGGFGSSIRGVPGSAESTFPAGSLPDRSLPIPEVIETQSALF
jgi:hypothetical protein